MTEVVPPLITPLTDRGTVDRPSLTRLVRHVVSEGAGGVLVLGSTGEGGHLLPDEQEAVVATAAAATDRDVMAGVAALNTRQAAQLAARFAAAGARSLLVPPPSMFPLSQTELARHFAAVAEAGGVPTIAYHVPSRVPTPVGAALLAELVAKGILAGVKDSSGDLGGHRAAVLATGRSPAVRLLTGSETCIDAALQIGFTGAVPGLSNVFTALHRALADAADAGDWPAARDVQDRLTRLHRIYEGPHGEGSFTAGAIGALKAALVELGVIETATLSEPFTPLGEDAVRHVRDVLREDRQ
ncbi:dihydrodipicolinate synthase family protein [Dactylosporangium sucinum]|uniref:Dihydrodipicolinate synthase family protein n=1 Tax=Dactylosporangium sucinum TaxID=1424081 RepID=A0A917TSF9_9ACTN|nr:dihydrodipicolinate synthase family protein [Dactylosporangium sucinum]GGM35995.1 dihydrodipicolinate synthase family protein [Dactylosporangium sucinum]